MLMKLSSWVAVLALTLAALALTGHREARSQVTPVPEHKVSVKSAGGADANGAPRAPTKTGKIKTNTTGNMGLRLTNNANVAASDLHLKVIHPAGAVIDKYTFYPPFGDSTVQDPNPNVATISGVVGTGLQPLGQGKECTVDVKVRDSAGNPVADGDVEFEIWWTRGTDNEVVHAVSPERVGPTDTWTAVSTLGFDGFDASLKELSREDIALLSGEVALNDVIIAERMNFRFGTGDMLLKLSHSLRFLTTEDIVIEARTESREAAAAADISFGEPRLDREGNLVFRVTRNVDATTHVAIRVCNLRIEGAEDLGLGAKLHVGVQCAAMQGFVVDEHQHVLSVIE
jgi:hypothetical protein